MGMISTVSIVRAQASCGSGNFMIVNGKCVSLDYLTAPRNQPSQGFTSNSRGSSSNGSSDRDPYDFLVEKAALIACYGNDDVSAAVDRGIDSATKESPNYLGRDNASNSPASFRPSARSVIRQMQSLCPSKFKDKPPIKDPFDGSNSGYKDPFDGSNSGYKDPFDGSNSGYKDPFDGSNSGYKDPFNGSNSGYRDPFSSK